jgi:hypothetical protein
VLQAGYRAGQLRIGAVLPTWNETPQATETIRQVLANLAQTEAHTRERLAFLIEDSLREGLDRHQIRSRIRSEFQDWRDWRADHAGQAAATGAFEEGQLEAWQDADVGGRRWLSQRDDKVRPEHDEADGQEVGVREAFVVGGESLMYPADPAASVEMTINCRCATLPVMTVAKAVTWLDRRDEEIREAFKRAKLEEPTAEQARLSVGEAFGLSDTQIQRIVYRGRRS